jgi:hypothetical protein
LKRLANVLKQTFKNVDVNGLCWWGRDGGLAASEN